MEEQSEILKFQERICLRVQYDFSSSRARYYCRISRRNYCRIISIFDRKRLSYRSRILSRPRESDTESIDHFIVLYPHLLT